MEIELEIKRVNVNNRILFDEVSLYTNLTSPSPDRFPTGDAILTIQTEVGKGIGF